jgi:hypothetical protein
MLRVKEKWNIVFGGKTKQEKKKKKTDIEIFTEAMLTSISPV